MGLRFTSVRGMPALREMKEIVIVWTRKQRINLVKNDQNCTQKMEFHQRNSEQYYFCGEPSKNEILHRLTVAYI